MAENREWQRIAGNAAVVKGGRRDNGVQKACGKGTVEKAIPQRQRNAESAAVVVRVRVAIYMGEEVCKSWRRCMFSLNRPVRPATIEVSQSK